MQSPAERLASLPKAERDGIIASFTPDQLEQLLYDWEGFNARPEQIAPPGDWDVWAAIAGRGWGKTRVGSEWVRKQVKAGSKRIALIAETQKDLEDVMVNGESGIMNVFPPNERPKVTYKPIRMVFPNGAIALGYNGTEPGQLRGPQFDCFVAGTMVSMPNGQKPIESLCVGDMALTRSGPRRIFETHASTKQVGLISFSNGSSFIATPDHPVYSMGRWVAAALLSEGDTVCVTNALSGVKSAGIPIRENILSSEGRAALVDWIGRGFTGRSILKRTARFLKDAIFTTLTETFSTMTCQTLGLSAAPSTCVGTDLKSQSQEVTAKSRSALHASIAGKPNKGAQIRNVFAQNAHQGEQSKNGKAKGIASAAEKRSLAEVETFAASVVSTWQPLGEQKVFCLSVEGEHEFFANGVLVHNCAWVDELAKFRYGRETWDMLQFALRLGDKPRVLVTTTPLPTDIIKDIVVGKEGKVHVTRGSTYDNASNLAAPFLKKIKDRYENTRLGRQELHAEILGDLPGALWTQASLDAYRVADVPELGRTVVGVDLAITNTENSDEHGIIVAAMNGDQRGIVLEDASLTGTPNEWARRAISMYREWDADAIVIEVNQGGDMVANTLRTIDPNVKIREVRASSGKHIRASHVSALYEQGKIVHLGRLSQLEAQMVQMTSAGYQGSDSPDRVDALVWAMTDLFPHITKKIVQPAFIPMPAMGLGAGRRL